MTESILKRFPVVSHEGYYVSLGKSIRDIFGFSFGNSDRVLCLKRGSDGDNYYQYSFCGFAFKNKVKYCNIVGKDYFIFPKTVSRALVVPKDGFFYVYYADDGSVCFSRDEPLRYDSIENVLMGERLLISRSLDMRMYDSFYVVMNDDGTFVLVPSDSAMWSFIYFDSGMCNFLVEDLYDFIVRRDDGGEFVIIRYDGDSPKKFEVFNNVGYKA